MKRYLRATAAALALASTLTLLTAYGENSSDGSDSVGPAAISSQPVPPDSKDFSAAQKVVFNEKRTLEIEVVTFYARRYEIPSSPDSVVDYVRVLSTSITVRGLKSDAPIEVKLEAYGMGSGNVLLGTDVHTYKRTKTARAGDAFHLEFPDINCGGTPKVNMRVYLTQKDPDTGDTYRLRHPYTVGYHGKGSG